MNVKVQEEIGLQTFVLRGVEMRYANASYNTTRQNERAVEVPSALHLYRQAKRQQRSVLEVGAVLPHYLPRWQGDEHTVVDLYERGPGFINEDICSWQPPQQYDLILSVSTLDYLRGPMELWIALTHMRSWLNPGGLLFITLPANQPPEVGGGKWLDALLRDRHALEASDLWRIDKVDPVRHLWEEVTGTQQAARGYNSPTYYANTVYFLFYGEVRSWWLTD